MNSGTALVRVNQAIARLESKDRDVDAWMAQHMTFKSVKYKVNANRSARAAGYEAGKSINLAARGALPSGAKRLK